MTKSDLFSGKRFMLDCFTPAIAIGPGGFRSSETMPLMVGDSQIGSVEELVFHPITGYVITWWYKGEWFLSDLDHLLKEYPENDWSDKWSEAAEKAVTCRLKYI